MNIKLSSQFPVLSLKSESDSTHNLRQNDLDILRNPAYLCSIVEFLDGHIVKGTLFKSFLADEEKLETLGGEKITLKKEEDNCKWVCCKMSNK